jgi:hypothetical protein
MKNKDKVIIDKIPPLPPINKPQDLNLTDPYQVLNLNTLPFISQFKVLAFQGSANGSVLTNMFSDTEVSGKRVVIKSLKIVPYYNNGFGNNVNFFLRDKIAGVDYSEIINANDLLSQNFIYEGFNSGRIELKINGVNCIFPTPTVNSNSYTSLKDFDNMFFYFPEKISTITLLTEFVYKTDISENIQFDFDNMLVKVFLEVYLL